MPPLKKSEPLAEFGFTTSDGRESATLNVCPPSVDSYSPTAGAFGGVKRPPEVADGPWRAAAVAMNRGVGLPGATATVPMPPSLATATLPETSDHFWPLFVDL